METSTQSTTGARRLLRLPEVARLTGLGKSKIYADIAAGAFPAPVRLSPRLVAWDSVAIASWIDQRIADGAAR